MIGVVEGRLAGLNLELPAPRVYAAANLSPTVRTGNLLFISGHGPFAGERLAYHGKLGREFSVEQGYAAARLACLGCLASAKVALGSLDKIVRVVKVLGFVNGVEGFTMQPAVINGASDLLVALYGEAGRHARSAVSAAELPNGMAVEVEMVVEVEA